MTADRDARLAPSDGVGGRRVVLSLYLVVVAIAGVMGALIGYVHPQGMDPTLFFLVDLPPTVLGMVAYGVSTVGVSLGALLVLVRFVSRYDGARVD